MALNLKQLSRVALVAAAMGLLSFVDFRLLHVNSATAAFTFLIVILGLATRAGSLEAVTASVASMLAYNFLFLPPIGQLRISDPQNWVALIAFVTTAITASKLSASVRKRAEEAEARRNELQRLYEFSQAVMPLDDREELIAQAIERVSALFGAAGVRIYDAESGRVSGEGSEDSAGFLHRVASSAAVVRDDTERATGAPIRLEGKTLGSLAVSSESAVSDVALQSLAQLIGIGMERARGRKAAALAEAMRQNERLKSTLLDALAHEFKTPLTAIKASTTTMLSQAGLDATENELTTIIDEEADRMTTLVNDAIELARVGSGGVILSPELCPVDEIVRLAVNDMRTVSDGHEVRVDIEPGLPLAAVDRKLIRIVVRQLLGNAFKYSCADSPVCIHVRKETDAIVTCVSNEGAAIPEREREMIFHKFYRGRAVRDQIPGTGMGLSISREIIEAHRGRLWMHNAPANRVAFAFSLPGDASAARAETG